MKWVILILRLIYYLLYQPDSVKKYGNTSAKTFAATPVAVTVMLLAPKSHHIISKR